MLTHWYRCSISIHPFYLYPSWNILLIFFFVYLEWWMKTALMHACRHGHWEVVQMLLLFRCNVWYCSVAFLVSSIFSDTWKVLTSLCVWVACEGYQGGLLEWPNSIAFRST
jgi:hypothetical protein